MYLIYLIDSDTCERVAVRRDIDQGMWIRWQIKTHQNYEYYIIQSKKIKEREIIFLQVEKFKLSVLYYFSKKTNIWIISIFHFHYCLWWAFLLRSTILTICALPILYITTSHDATGYWLEHPPYFSFKSDRDCSVYPNENEKRNRQRNEIVLFLFSISISSWNRKHSINKCRRNFSLFLIFMSVYPQIDAFLYILQNLFCLLYNSVSDNYPHFQYFQSLMNKEIMFIFPIFDL